MPEGGEVVNGQVVGYAKPTDDDPTRPEKNHAYGRDTAYNDATLIIVFQLSTPDHPVILKRRLIPLSVKKLHLK